MNKSLICIVVLERVRKLLELEENSRKLEISKEKIKSLGESL